MPVRLGVIALMLAGFACGELQPVKPDASSNDAASNVDAHSVDATTSCVLDDATLDNCRL